MELKEAIHKTKEYVSELFAGEEISNLGLEEFNYHKKHGFWEITVGFSRPWNTPRSRAQELLDKIGSIPSIKRSYKVVTLSNDGELVSIRDRVRDL